jgi:hypothetical protein
MNIKLQDLLPEELSDESAFQVIQFIQGLSLVLDLIYYKLKRTNYKRYEKKSYYCFKPDDIEKPFLRKIKHKHAWKRATQVQSC